MKTETTSEEKSSDEFLMWGKLFADEVVYWGEFKYSKNRTQQFNECLGQNDDKPAKTLKVFKNQVTRKYKFHLNKR
jgi:hypothetical protein